MLLKTIKTSFRVLWYHRFNTLINIAGLSIGIASCLLIMLFVQNEWSYDQHHTKKNRIYRVVSDLSMGGEDDKSGMSSFMLSPTLKTDYPQIEEAIRVMPAGKQTMWVDEKPFQFSDNLMSDAGFFTIFDYEFIEGDPKTALAQPQSVVITDETANRLFGASSGLLGKMIKYARQSYKVTGVIRDVKNNSHLYFNSILSLNSIPPQYENTLKNDWFYLAQSNYVLFKSESDAATFESKLDQLRDKYIVPWLKQVKSEGKISFKLQHLTSIHLDGAYSSGYVKTGNKAYTYILSLLALFILCIACINYINLATATSAKRAKEIGIRKTAGANSATLFMQFITESFLIVLIAVLLALIWMHAMLPLFNQITDKSLVLHYSISNILQLLGIIIVIALLAGLYPALYLSRLQAVLVIKANKMPGATTGWVRKTLVVAQFLMAMLFMICTMVIYAQMHYLKNTSMGFDKDQLLVVNVPVPDTSFVNKFEVVRQELQQIPSIKSIALSNNIPGAPSGTLIHSIETPDHQIQEKAINFMMVSHDLIPILGIPIVAGRNFKRDYTTDDTAAFIINETAAKTYGWQEPLNYTLENGFGYKGKIIGVVKDFNYKSLHEPIEPLVMMLGNRLQGNLLLKIEAGKEAETIEKVANTFGKYSRKYPFEYFFLDDNFNKLYKNEDRMMKLFTTFSLISLIISCLGLYALVTFSLQQRVKEIGIRKVMGASISNIVQTITKEYLPLLGIAIIIALPLSWYLANRWLADFAHRIPLSYWLFANPIIITLFLALTTICIKTALAAAAKPVNSLRYE